MISTQLGNNNVVYELSLNELLIIIKIIYIRETFRPEISPHVDMHSLIVCTGDHSLLIPISIFYNLNFPNPEI